MEVHVATIFHISDLHLLHDESGGLRPMSEVSGSVQFFRRSAARSGLDWYKSLVDGFALPNTTAWRKLIARLPEIVAEERKSVADGVPIIVLQGGDVETFGASLLRERNGLDPLPGFSFLQNVLWPRLISNGATGCVDLFGNHDLWAGTFPLFTPFSHIKNAFQRIGSISGLQGPWPDRVDFPSVDGCRLELFRINSVAPDPMFGSLAAGMLIPHPPQQLLPNSGSRSAVRELEALANQRPGTGAEHTVRIVATHHPPHLFDPTWSDRFTTGVLLGADSLAQSAARIPVHAILAGHRHRLDPADRERAGPQVPLPSRTVQLVCESPTQRFEPGAAPGRNSFSCYRLILDKQSKTLRISRVVFRYRDSALVPFRPGQPVDVIDGIPL